MHSQFVNGFMSIISGIISKSDLDIISEKLSIYTLDFDISKKETALTKYEPFPECAKAYLVTRKMEGLSENSLKNYYGHLKAFFDAVCIPIDDIKKQHIVKYISDLKTSDRSKSATLTVLKTFFQWAVNEEYIVKNPCMNIKPIKYQRKSPEHLTDVELEMLRNACSDERERAIFEFFYSTGCRVSEAINVNISDVDFDNCEVTLFGKGSKYRKDYLNPRALLALKVYLANRTDKNPALFVSCKKPYNRISSKNTYENFFRELGERAGVTKYVHPHLMRHTNATLALEKGMPIEEVQKMLGHVNMNTTLVYAEVADTSVKRNHRRCVV